MDRHDALPSSLPSPHSEHRRIVVEGDVLRLQRERLTYAQARAPHTEHQQPRVWIVGRGDDACDLLRREVLWEFFFWSTRHVASAL